MARFVLVALVWSAVQGEEYGGGGMPQYGGVGADYAEPVAAVASADYTGHSPDAPAPLDYKYIEDPNGSREKFQKDVDDTNRWEQDRRPKERRSRHDKDELDMVDSETAVPKHKPNRRTRHRSRLKSEKPREPRRRRRNRTNRGNEDNDDVMREYMRDNHYRDEIKSEPLDEERIPIKETTEIIIRRKARDRHFAPPPKSVELESEDEIGSVRKSPGKNIDTETEDEILGPVRKMKDDDDKPESDYNIAQNRRHGQGRPPLPPTFDTDDDDQIDSDIDFKKNSGGKRKYSKNYPDYNAYYDMKRVYNIKNRLPMLLRRTTTTIPTLEEDTTTDVLKVLWTARRAAAPCTITLRTMPTTKITARTAIKTIASLNPVVIPLNQLSTTKNLLSPAPLQFTDFPTTQKELSLAERSRLSILKKAHRKESDKPAMSTKPPILLQVTNKIPTVVMVEPPGADPWMRAKEISHDTPQRLEKVKRLMRQKLVSEAKNIKELTDNWDEMICDYIDTSVLDSQACNRKVESWLLIVCYALCYLISKHL